VSIAGEAESGCKTRRLADGMILSPDSLFRPDSAGISRRRATCNNGAGVRSHHCSTRYFDSIVDR
jgi:hypothetical protein